MKFKLEFKEVKLAARHLNRPSSLQFEKAFGSTWLRYALVSQ